MSAQPLQEDAARAYLYEDFAGAFSCDLLDRSIAGNLEDLFRLTGQACELFGEDGERLKQAREIFAASSCETLFALAAEPAAYHWVCLARMFVKEAAGAPRDSVLRYYEKEYRLSPEEFRRRHLQDFVRFALAATVLEARSGSSPCGFSMPVSNPFGWVLPGTGILLVPPHDGAVLGPLSRESIRLLAAQQEGRFEDRNALTWSAVRQRGGNARVPIVVDTQDGCMRLQFVESYPRVEGDDKLAKFEDTLAETLQILGAFNPSMSAEVCTFVKRVCPMHTASRALVSSGSVSSLFGAVFISATKDPFFLAEMLIHEFGHNKLRLLDDHFRLLADEAFACYSPWRNEPRPLDGVMHGLYVFSLVASFWLWVHHTADTPEQAEIAERRLRTLLPQLESALAEFKAKATCTASGMAYLSVVNEIITTLRKRMPPFSSAMLKPLYVGVVADKELLEMPIEASVVRHRELFLERFGKNG